MSVRLPAALAALAALAGGGVWVLRWLTDGPVVLHWVGLALVGVALAAVGSNLAGRGLLALRVVVALASALLVLSLVELARPASDPPSYGGLLGAALAMAAVMALVASRPPRAPAGRRRAG